MSRSTTLTAISSILIGSGLSLLPLSSAEADDASYPIAWTDIGIYPREGPSMESGRVGSALSNGTTVSIECETTGQSVDNGFAPTSIWERLSDGTYLPNAFIYTGVDGWTPGIPRCDESEEDATEVAVDDSPNESPKGYSGLWIANDRVSTQLINHYYSATGEAVVVDWSYFMQSARLVEALKRLPQPEGFGTYQSTPWDDGDIYNAAGAFTIARTSEHCYAVKDTYDFAPDKPENYVYLLNWFDALQGRAAEFETQSSGCIF
jgi:hypothetical protein